MSDNLCVFEKFKLPKKLDKPLILIGQDANAQLFSILLTFKSKKLNITSSVISDNKLNIPHIDDTKINIINDVYLMEKNCKSSKESPLCYDIYSDYKNIIILPPQRTPSNITKQNNFQIIKISDEFKNNDWYWWISNLEKIKPERIEHPTNFYTKRIPIKGGFIEHVLNLSNNSHE